MNHDLQVGDVLEVLRREPTDSFDGCLTDPPYGLSFMGKAWDHGVPGVEIWREVLRVLKPGAIMLAFGGTRTYHRLACAIEDAGFEIRDCLMWLYGSGFPKSHAIDKGIDKKRDDDKPAREVGSWLRSKRESAGLTQKQIAKHWPSVTGGLTGCVANWELGFNVPKWDQWLTLKSLIGFDNEMDAEVWRLNGRKGQPGESWYEREVIGSKRACIGIPGGGVPEHLKHIPITAPATPEAQRWSGYGTALKPAYEPILVAMKPLDGTFAENALQHGVAGLNIDGCRIGTTTQGRWPANLILDETAAAALDQMSGVSKSNGHWPKHKPTFGDGVKYGKAAPFDQEERYTNDSGGASRFFYVAESEQSKHTGRWPANLILDETAAAALDQMSGTLHTHPGTARKDIIRNWFGNSMPARKSGAVLSHGDSGGASRFYYCAKASRRERGEGNTHPTVKPIALAEYLARLILPPAGRERRLLVPFSGSGSEMLGAKRAGWEYALGIDNNADYVAIAGRRLNGAGAPDPVIPGLFDEAGLEGSNGWLGN